VSVYFSVNIKFGVRYETDTVSGNAHDILNKIPPDMMLLRDNWTID